MQCRNTPFIRDQEPPRFACCHTRSSSINQAVTFVAAPGESGNIQCRMMTLSDLDRDPLAYQGTREDVQERIATLGAAAVLAFDGARHVGQLQCRRYAPLLRSVRGGGLLGRLRRTRADPAQVARVGCCVKRLK